MTRMKAFFRVGTVALVILLCGLPLSASLARQDGGESCAPAVGEPIRLGAIFPQRALFSVSVADPFQGAEAMRRAVNACGGVAGRPVEWVYEPAAARDDAEAAARRLVEAGVPLIVGSGALAVSEGAGPVAEAAGVVFWEGTASTLPAGAWMFSTRPSNAQLGQQAAAFVQSEVAALVGRADPRVALIYEARARGRQVAEGVLDGLASPPLIRYAYANDLVDPYPLAVNIRDQRIDAVVLSAFDNDGAWLWYALREADANVGAWIHVGSTGYIRSLCGRAGNIDGFVSVSAAGQVSSAYREQAAGPVYAAYREAYRDAFGAAPSDLADLSASSVDLLLRRVLPRVEGAYTPEAIRRAILSLDEPGPLGLMGEGLAFDPATGLNRYPGVVVQQQQGRSFCAVWPGEIATCADPLRPFPTWRQRALAEYNPAYCGPSA